MSKNVPSYEHRRLSPVLVEIPPTARADMRVPARLWADEVLWGQMRHDRTVEQLVNVTTLPGITGCAQAMPDAHEGYGFPVGGVAAFRAEDGIISPGGVGYDINCGVRLLACDVPAAEARPRLAGLVHDLARSVPAGAGRGRKEGLDDRELHQVLARGCQRLVETGLARPEDLECIEAGGCLPSADPAAVSERARQRGKDQLGTLGSGNHFIEVQEVAEVRDAPAAAALGLEVGHLAVLVHSGSRGLGHQTCTDHVRLADAAAARHRIRLVDRELACVPFRSAEGRHYFAAMSAAANFAFANRQAMTHEIRRVFARHLGATAVLRLVYDVAHNMAKLERHGRQDVVVHRKGATRAFGPSHPETPERYRGVGQPVLIPGSMGTSSWVLVGTDTALGESFGSACHGAGRTMSRTAARKVRPGHVVRAELAAAGIVVECPSSPELAEEAPHAYKDVDRVVRVVEEAGLARRVARLVPLGVVKG